MGEASLCVAFGLVSVETFRHGRVVYQLTIWTLNGVPVAFCAMSVESLPSFTLIKIIATFRVGIATVRQTVTIVFIRVDFDVLGRCFLVVGAGGRGQETSQAL